MSLQSTIQCRVGIPMLKKKKKRNKNIATAISNSVMLLAVSRTFWLLILKNFQNGHTCWNPFTKIKNTNFSNQVHGAFLSPNSATITYIARFWNKKAKKKIHGRSSWDLYVRSHSWRPVQIQAIPWIWDGNRGSHFGCWIEYFIIVNAMFLFISSIDNVMKLQMMMASK